MDFVMDTAKLVAIKALADSEGDYAEAASPPVSPPADVVSDDELLRWFWAIYIPTNQQHFRNYDAASKTQKFRGPITTDRGDPEDCALLEPRPEDANKSEFTDEELQVLVDGSLRGDQFLTWKPLVNDHHRQLTDVLARELELVNERVPEMWLWSRANAYKEIRDRTHDGEQALRAEEWKEVVIWVRKSYVGLNGRVFHYSRSTERIRQEVRVIEDLDDDTIVRLGEIFLEERRLATPPKLKKLVPEKCTPFKPGNKATKEAIEKQKATKKKKREAEQGGAASTSNAVTKKAKKVQKAKNIKTVANNTERKEQDMEE